MTTASTPDYRQPEIITVPADTAEVACDGGNEVLGHPRVYYRFDGQPKVTCGYCDREFVKQTA
mgnify:FL=1